jgi:hypothetical protein
MVVLDDSNYHEHQTFLSTFVCFSVYDTANRSRRSQKPQFPVITKNNVSKKGRIKLKEEKKLKKYIEAELFTIFVWRTFQKLALGLLAP